MHEHYEDGSILSSETEKIISLTRNEAMFIDDSLTMIIEKEQGDERITTVRPLTHTAGLPAPVDLLERIGVAILFTTDPENKDLEAQVYVSDTDLYMLREISHSYIKVGEEAVGFNLKRKIYNLLYKQSYEREKVARDIIDQLDMNVPLDDTIPSRLEDMLNNKEG